MRGRPEENGRNDCTGDHSAHKDVGRSAAGEVYEQNAENCAQHGDSAEYEWINYRRRISRQRERANQYGADQAHRVGLEDVGGHACAIPDVVADVVCNRGGITRIIFFKALLDLANEIRADIGGLGVNAAAKSCEHADETSPKGKTYQATNRHLRSDNM